jgi:AraC-like DNA-binding protein
MSILVKEYSPTAALRPFVLLYWEGIFEGTPMAALQQKVMPSGYIELVLHVSDARCELYINNAWQLSAAFSLVGMWTDPFMLRFRGKVEAFGIRFKPEAIYVLFGIPAAEFINCSANLEEIFGPCFASFCLKLEESKTIEERVQLADNYFLRRLYKSDIRQTYVQSAAELIRRQSVPSVEHISHRVCISTRQLEREFKSKVGLSPKSYMRITRLNKALQLMSHSPALPLAQVAYLCGYADQAHFNREFKALSGELPTTYIANQLSFMIS